MFTRFSWERPVRESYLLPTGYLIKVRPGTTAAFEEKLMAKLRTIAKGWTFEIKTLGEMRESLLKQMIPFPIMLGAIGAFLMLMVGLGLIGVLWQNVIQRTKEIGLRRATGATTQRIYMQIFGELFVITSVGVAIGIAVVIQFPLLKVIGFAVSGKAYMYGLEISFVLIYGLVILCGLYPSYLATRIHPAEALHYE
jgi:putative ABC transport system permease protein